ncbi:MAG: bifunctional hydroxymethylpyrimidine kinase/phosphomethylpyrimidine kinase [Verrucomicrobiae bacterium]|nr:bifunctional hydroxymethylpyrimidine kinase/phosphomethylpyrimidine kinase [Verrucomicrobiae bacterium]
MILVSGLTPAWQQILVFDRFAAGEVNRASEAHWCASGKVLNAGIAAHHLGGPSLTLSPLGGPAFDPISREFEGMGIPHQWIRTAAPTRVCTTLIDRATATITELVENGKPIAPREMESYLAAHACAAKRASVAVVIGSLPAGTPDSCYRTLLESTPCPAVLDFRGEGLLSVLDLRPLVIKPNRNELAATLGQPLDSDDGLLAAMRSLNDRGAHWVVVTQGAGPVWLTSRTETHRLPPAHIPDLVNPIASGDAMAAAIAWAIATGRSVPEAVQLGIAAAAQNARQLLPCRLDPKALGI